MMMMIMIMTTMIMMITMRVKHNTCKVRGGKVAAKIR